MMRYRETELVLARDIVRPDFEPEHRSHRLAGGLRLDTVTADGRTQADDPTILMTLPWSEFVARPDATDRYSIIADELGARVIAIDNLGVSGRSRLPHSIARDIRRGNFDSLSSAQWEALQQVDSYLGKNALAMFSYSLGGIVAMSLAKNAPEEMHFDSLLLAETVGIKGRIIEDLGRAFMSEMEAWKKYWPENPTWMHQPGNDLKIIGRMATHMAGHISYPLGLAKGTLLEIAEHAYGRSIDSTTNVHVMSGEMSTVSPLADNLLLAEKFSELGVRHVTQDIFLGETHGMIDSVNRLVPALETVLFSE
jgi:pimeloyl-ACP methyl ester carboxylesterase